MVRSLYSDDAHNALSACTGPILHNHLQIVAIMCIPNCREQWQKQSLMRADNYVIVLSVTLLNNHSITVKAIISTTNLAACVRVCVCAKFDQFLPVRSHFDTKRPVNVFHIATFPSPTFGPLFAFHCPLFFLRKTII